MYNMCTLHAYYAYISCTLCVNYLCTSIHYSRITCTLCVHYAYITCTFCVYYMYIMHYITCTLRVHAKYITRTFHIHVHYAYFTCPLRVHDMYIMRTLHVHYGMLQYTLETFCEARSTGYEQEPFRGQPIDGPQYGPPPPPWDIPVQPDGHFRDHVKKVEVPHTATIQVR